MDNEKNEFENDVVENLEEDVLNVSEEVSEEVAEEVDKEIVEELSYSEADDVIEESEESGENSDFYAEESVENDEYTVFSKGVSDSDYENLEITAKKNRKPLFVILGVVAAIIVAFCIYCACYTNSVGLKSAVNTLPPDEVSSAGEIVRAEKMNIKFENPVIAMVEGKAGTMVSAVKVGNYGVPADVFRYFVTSEALNYEYKLYQTKKITDLNAFDWNATDEDSGLTHAEIVKIKAVRTIFPIVAVIAEAGKRGITLTEEESAEITTYIEQIKQNYADNLEQTLKMSGYESIEQLENIQKIQRVYEKAFNAFYDDPASYVKNFKNADEVITDDKVTVKHILLQFPEGVTAESDDAAKAEILKKAEEVLKKAKDGEDFDKLIEEYNEDPGQGTSGYTFSNDGTMVQEFADASFKLEVGQISELVETSYGYHIIKRVERVADFAEYTELLTKNSEIKVNRKIYTDTPVNVNLAEMLGETAAQE